MPTSSTDWSTLASEYERLADSSAIQAPPRPADSPAPQAAAPQAAGPQAAAPRPAAPQATA